MCLRSQSTHTLVDEYDKITWIGNLLGGKPGKWWSSFGLTTKDKAPAHRRDLEAFWEQLRLCFEKRRLPFEDELEFINFEQGGSDIASFNAQFRQLSAGINWSREKFEAAFYLSKLSGHYVNHLRSSPPMPESAEAMMASTSLADPRFMSLVTDSRKKGASSFPFRDNSNSQPVLVSKPERRCFECHQPGHLRPQCPLLRGKSRVGSFPPNKNTSQGKGPATRQ